MYVSLTLRDGALGQSGAAVYGMACLGTATGGPLNTVVGVADAQAAYTAWTSGELPDRAAAHFANGGTSPFYGVRCAASTAGSIPSWQQTVHAAVAANAANTFPGPISFTGPSNVEVVFAAAWDGGNITVTGAAKDGSTITETITASAGSTVKGKRVFATISGIVKTATGATANTATVKTGNKIAEGGSATDAQLAISGTPTNDFILVVQFSRDTDTTAAGGAARFSWDGGSTYLNEVAVPAGGVISAYSTAYGVTVTLSGSAAKSGDTFRVPLVGPASTSGDLSAGLTALGNDPRTWEFLHILGAMSGALAATVESWIGAQRSAGRYMFVIAEARDNTLGESDATYQTSVLSDYASFISTYGQISVVVGYGPTVIPNKGIFRRSLAWTVATQVSRIPLAQHPGQPVLSGPLRGLFAFADGSGISHDERTQPGLGGSVGRFCTVQTIIGLQGYYVGDATGLRGAGTMAQGTSDYQSIMNVRVLMLSCRVLLAAGAKLLAAALKTKSTGQLLDSQAKTLDEGMTQALKIDVVDPGYATDCSVTASRTEVVAVTKHLPFSASVRLFGYAEAVDISIGAESITTT